LRRPGDHALRLRTFSTTGGRVVGAAGTVLLAIALPCAGAADSLEAVSAPAPSEPAIPAHLSLGDALRIFHERGFDLLLADAAVASAEGDLTIARAFPNPQVAGATGASFGYDPGKCDTSGCSRQPWNASVTDQGLLVDLVVGKRRLKTDVARAALQAARLSRVDADRTLTSLLKQQYVQTVLAGAVLGFAREAADSATQTAGLVTLRFRAGDVSEADTARADTAMLEAEQAVDAAQQALVAAQRSLAFLLGARGADVDFEVDPQLASGSPPAALAGATVDALVVEAREKRPDLAATQQLLASAEASVALAKRQRFPDVALVAGYAQEGRGQQAIQPPTATLGISATLPLLYQNAGEVAKAEAALRAQQIALAKLDAQITRDVTSAFVAYTSAASRIQRMESQLLDRARRARDLVDYQYKKGAASLLELLEAQRTYVATNAEYYQDMGDYWNALYALEEAVGAELGA
jgi:outer membrane protein, heavy metal efflux system